MSRGDRRYPIFKDHRDFVCLGKTPVQTLAKTQRNKWGDAKIDKASSIGLEIDSRRTEEASLDVSVEQPVASCRENVEMNLVSMLRTDPFMTRLRLRLCHQCFVVMLDSRNLLR